MSNSHSRPDPANPIDPTVAAIIRGKADRMVGGAGLRPQDREDIEHELVLRVLAQRDRFTEGRGTWPAFVWCVVERAGNNVLRARRRVKRAGAPGALPASAACRGDPDDLARAIDLADALAALPPDLRDLAHRLVTDTVADIARAWGLSRTTVHARVEELRARLAARELGDDP
ncbi:hypothetical protein J8F10_06185 [Gemmata sp. G18]|uniref:Sigma-70 family RNA polymerase sigma factor n=1 Tax=Gemmata palustris TaxID=2822762 RepID=A0ABS5BMH3_9BACT|nr:hypothetical protein [Gemmata palustris]MBP3954870.1 hypothetical protein [Gemmata palustris]